MSKRPGIEARAQRFRSGLLSLAANVTAREKQVRLLDHGEYAGKAGRRGRFKQVSKQPLLLLKDGGAD